MLNSIRDALPTVHREGWPFVAAALVLALVLGWLFAPLFWAFLIVAGWVGIFFRDPERVVPMAPGLVVSPADGRVEPIVRAAPPPELDAGDAPLTRISIFMNVFDCHINRSPVAGRIARIAYKAGQFLSADLDKASDVNERNSFLLETEGGATVAVVQIAGLVARRIVCWTEPGANLAAGQRIGMIRFGSRLDVYLPDGATVVASPGQRATAGETIIAILPGGTLAAPFQTRRD